MLKIKTFKMEQKFSGIDDFYGYLLKNIELIEKSIEIKIQRPLKDRLFCVTGKEEITERNILFFASKSEFTESLGESIILASTFDIDIVVFFISQSNKSNFKSINWLQKICNEDTQFIIGEVYFQ